MFGQISAYCMFVGLYALHFYLELFNPLSWAAFVSHEYRNYLGPTYLLTIFFEVVGKIRSADRSAVIVIRHSDSQSQNHPFLVPSSVSGRNWRPATAPRGLNGLHNIIYDHGYTRFHRHELRNWLTVMESKWGDKVDTAQPNINSLTVSAALHR